MTFIRTLRATFRRRPDHEVAQDIIESGSYSWGLSDDAATPAHHSSQGIRPYGFGY